MKRNCILIILGLVILNIAGAIYFIDRTRERSFHMIQRFMEERLIDQQMIKRMALDLDLDHHQIDAMMEISRSYEEKMKPYRDKLTPLHRDMNAVMMSEKPFDEKALRALMEEIDKQRREIRILTLEQRFELEKVMTAQQRKKHYERLYDMGRHFRKGFGIPGSPPDSDGPPDHPGPPPDPDGPPDHSGPPHYPDGPPDHSGPPREFEGRR